MFISRVIGIVVVIVKVFYGLCVSVLIIISVSMVSMIIISMSMLIIVMMLGNGFSLLCSMLLSEWLL